MSDINNINDSAEEDLPTQEELEKIIRQLKKNKLVEPDGRCNESINKNDGRITLFNTTYSLR